MGSCRGDLQAQIRFASGKTNLSRILLTGLVLHLCRKMYIHLYTCIWNQCLNQWTVLTTTRKIGLTEALHRFLICILCFVATVLWKQESFCSLGTEDPPFSASQVYDFFFLFFLIWAFSCSLWHLIPHDWYF